VETNKATLAQVIADITKSRFVTISTILCVEEAREALNCAGS
jgi:hypothetical protein